MTAHATLAWLCVLSGGCDAGITTIGSLVHDAGAADGGGATGLYLEAESGALSGGFRVEVEPTASAQHYLAPPDAISSDAAPGEARAQYDLSLERAGDYVIWGRIRSPGVDTNRFWFQLDGGSWTKWRISVGDIWYWDRFHDDTQYDDPLHFSLSAGAHTLVIANCVPGAALDRLYVSAGAEAPSGNATDCNPPHSIELSGQCQPSCGSQGGNRCGASACTGQPTLPAYDCDVCCREPEKM